MENKTSKDLRNEAQTLLENARKAERFEEVAKVADEAAHAISSLRQALINTGFTEEESYELIKIAMANGGRK